MNTYNIICPDHLAATITLPASKSISNRALIIYALTGGDNIPENLSDCDDTEVIIRALNTMSESPEINIKAAGTAMRFMTAMLAATDNGSHLLTGTERMKHRPIGILVDVLRRLGADISYEGEEGYPPLRITGRRLLGGDMEIAGNISSQFISALLLIAPVLKNGLSLRLTGDIISRPYIDLTLWMMREYGAKADWSLPDTITVKAEPYQPRPYLIENDWSAASYWYEMVALSKDESTEIRLQGLMDGSKQGDSGIRYLFSMLGVKTKFLSRQAGVPTTVVLKKSNSCVKHLEYDFTNMPDMAQTLVATCCALGVTFHFIGLKTLKIKETDRIEALKKELKKLGFVLHDSNNSELFWDGERCEPDVTPAIDTYEDHRMALAFAPLAFRFPLLINHPEVVSKSYPHFWEDLRNAGFNIQQP